DLPDPLGPTTQVMPGSKRRVVDEAKDLKPFSVRLLRYMTENLTGGSALDESGQVAAGGIPALDDEAHVAGRLVRPQPSEEFFECGTRTFGDDEDTPVGVIGGVADEAEFECSGPGEPSEPDPLDPAVHPGREPIRTGGGHQDSGVMVSET